MHGDIERMKRQKLFRGVEGGVHVDTRLRLLQIPDATDSSRQCIDAGLRRKLLNRARDLGAAVVFEPCDDDVYAWGDKGQRTIVNAESLDFESDGLVGRLRALGRLWDDVVVRAPIGADEQVYLGRVHLDRLDCDLTPQNEPNQVDARADRLGREERDLREVAFPGDRQLGGRRRERRKRR